MSDIQFSTWAHFIGLCELPVAVELRETYDAASPYQAECLAAMWHYAAIGAGSDAIQANKNPLGVQTDGSFFGLAKFETYAECIKYWLGKYTYNLYAPDDDPKRVGHFTKAILEYDATPPPPAEPLPERLTQPMETDLRRWFCSNNRLEYDERVYVAWRYIATNHNLFPELLRISEDERGSIYHFESGLKIICADTDTGVMYCNKDQA